MSSLVSVAVSSTSLQIKGGELKKILTQHPCVDQLNYCDSSNKIEWHTFLPQTAAVDVHEVKEDGPIFFEDLNEKLKFNSSPVEPTNQQNRSFPPFTTGWVGHLNYEAAAWIEPSLDLQPSGMDFPIGCFRKYETSISWNVDMNKMWLFGSSQGAVEAFIGELNALLQEAELADTSISIRNRTTDSSESQFQGQVSSLQQRILAGDIFQANLTRMLTVELGDASRATVAGFAERLLTQSQAPFGAVLNFPNATIISASPERFFRIEPSSEGRRIFAEPIKGTRPRDPDTEVDVANKKELLESEKDRAENIMIADLVRNDLSRVCTDESIVADPICELRSFKNVHHLVTRISGILRGDVSNLDALLAQFPCGSITGAPKWAAMDAIAELEQRGRGVYCGTIGYFDDRGHADFSVAIRTALASFSESGTTLSYGTGGGITILSDPEEEFQETEDKAAGFLRALQL